MERLTPEEILENIKQSEEQPMGKLKIFLGYAAGVGKTYHMLDLATELRKVGTDVIVGYIEKHDRKETLDLLNGFELLPTKQIKYKNMDLNEFDVELAIKRKPKLILIDELAHTNAKGMKHKKRYEDVKELLENGIDVYTTLNIQHIESISIRVQEITQIKVSEIVPDELVKQANNIELIDIEPEELLLRINSGKVYKTDKIEHAKHNFFTLENLIKLREIALQYMFNLVDKKNISMTMKKKTIIVLDISQNAIKRIQKINNDDFVINSNIIILAVKKNQYFNKRYRDLARKQEETAKKYKIMYQEIEKKYLLKEILKITEETEVIRVILVKKMLKNNPILMYLLITKLKKQDVFFSK